MFLMLRLFPRLMPAPFAALLPLAGKLLGGTALRGLATAGARQGAAVAAKEGGKAAAKEGGKTAAKEGGKQLAQEAAKEGAKSMGKDFAMNQAFNTLQQSHQMNQQKDAEHLRRVQDHAQSSQQGTTTGFGQ